MEHVGPTADASIDCIGFVPHVAGGFQPRRAFNFHRLSRWPGFRGEAAQVAPFFSAKDASCKTVMTRLYQRKFRVRHPCYCIVTI